jgi:hypothetical protein
MLCPYKCGLQRKKGSDLISHMKRCDLGLSPRKETSSLRTSVASKFELSPATHMKEDDDLILE